MLRIGGDILVVGVPGELFAEAGLAMRAQRLCKHLFIAGCANGYVGYLPSDSSCRIDGSKPRYDWHRLFRYPSCIAEGCEKAILGAVQELVEVTAR